MINNYFNKILKTDYYNLGREWCYKNLKPKLIIEELLNDSNGNIPVDYKFYCFNGEVKFLQVDFDRYSAHKRNLYDPDFNLINCGYAFPNKQITAFPPENFKELKLIASILSKGLDFIRVDLYSVENKAYFGEMTNYPENGFGRFEPNEYDLFFGRYWRLK